MRFEKKDKILVVAAHPDDEVLGCGGTISSLKKKGIKIKILFLSEGVSSRFDYRNIDQKKFYKEIKERRDNSIKALRVLGVNKNDIYFKNLPCCQLDTIPILDLTKIIEKHIYDFKPSIIFTHSMNDTNIDHNITFKAVCSATRPVNKSFLKTIYLFEILSSSEWNFKEPFKANCFYDISKTINKKISAMKMYKKEFRKYPHPRSLEVIKALAVYRGAQVGQKFSEAFNLLRTQD